MAQWKETLEPYVKVQERVKTATLNPTAGEDLIIGVAFISDAGPSTPTLITSQSEFLSTYASKDLDQEYIESLNELYNGDNSDLAATMWSNAYRLAGSNSLLCVRASKGDNLYFTKPLTTETTQDTYILRDSELLKKVPSFWFSVDDIGDEADWDSDGWIINISGIGIFGNRVTDDGAQYDYYCQNLADLVKQLNDTSMFFSPKYTFYDPSNNPIDVDMDDITSYGPYDILKVKLEQVYLGHEIIDTSNDNTKKTALSPVEVEAYSSEAIYSIDDLVTVNVDGLRWVGSAPTETQPQDVQAAEQGFDPSEPPAQSYSAGNQVYTTIDDQGTTKYIVWTATTVLLDVDCYKSLVNENQGNDPASSTNKWSKLTSTDYIEKQTYNDIVIAKNKSCDKVYKDLEDLKYYTFTPDSTATNTGMLFIYSLDADGTSIINLNTTTYSGFTAASNYAVNVYNSTTDGLGVRIRKFNHNAVVIRTLNSSDTATLTKNGLSPYTVLPSTVANLNPEAEETQKNDFYEIAVYDPSINEAVSFFNIGNILARGDMEASEVNSLLSMIQLRLPDDMNDLNLEYYGIENITGEEWRWNSANVYSKNQVVYVESNSIKTVYRSQVNHNSTNPSIPIPEYNPENTYSEFAIVKHSDKYYQANQSNITGTWDATKWNEISEPWKEIDTPSQIYVDLAISGDDLNIIKISDSDLKRALDLIVLDEVYTTEGLCDLGNTDTSFQNYMANIAINDNYFYPISTVNSTNYMVIGNSATKIAADSYKLYMSSPWDIDTGTLGWKFYASPSVLYWETVAKNRRNNREFAPMFGQDNGTMQYQRPFTEFNKKTRQLLLSRKINTVMWDVALQAWVMNDNYTKQTENTIMNDEGNSRLMIRISKAMPIILKQFLGKRISEKLCESVESTIDYFFKTNILKMDYNIDSYLITCKYDEALARQNKIRVKVEVKYQRALKYIEVFNEAIEVGMDFEG